MMKKKKNAADVAKEVDSCMELKPNPQILLIQNKSLAHKCEALRKELDDMGRTRAKLEKISSSLGLFLGKAIDTLSEVVCTSSNVDSDVIQTDLIKMAEHKKLSLDVPMTNGTDGAREESKGSATEELPEPYWTQTKQMTRLLEAVHKFASGHPRPNGKSDLGAISDRLLKDRSKEDERARSFEVRLAKQANEIEVIKALLRKAEDDSKEKTKTIDDLETKVLKLSRRLQVSSMTPYVLIAKQHQFCEAPGPHDCLCIVCGETMKGCSASGDSPEPHNTDPMQLARAPSVPAAGGEFASKGRVLEEEVQRLATENMELKKDIAERTMKSVRGRQATEQDLTEDMVLESKTFETLLGQAEQIARDYAVLKEKYSVLKRKYKETCEKREEELKENAVLATTYHEQIQATKRLQQIIAEVVAASKAAAEAKPVSEPPTLREEVESRYRATINAKQALIVSLEEDLVRANRQLEVLKKEHKARQAEKAKGMVEAGAEKDPQKLLALLQQRTQELENEKQTSDMWIAEVEATSKAYEQEKKQSKKLSQEVERLNETLTNLMMDIYRETKLKTQTEEERNQARQKVAALERELREQSGFRTKLEEQCTRMEEVQRSLKLEIEEKGRAMKEVQGLCQRGTERVETLRREIDREKQLVEGWKTRCIRSEGVKGMTDQVDKLMNDGEVSAKDPLDQLKLYKTALDNCRSLLRCTVCKVRNKDVVLTRCCHLFCKDCITKNLQMRQRQCPTCRQKFTADDVKQIWWDNQLRQLC